MITPVYTIKDLKAGVGIFPFSSLNDAVAIRNFEHYLDNSPFDATDYRLYRIGAYDDERLMFTDSGCTDYDGVRLPTEIIYTPKPRDVATIKET